MLELVNSGINAKHNIYHLWSRHRPGRAGRRKAKRFEIWQIASIKICSLMFSLFGRGRNSDIGEGAAVAFGVSRVLLDS